jgi:O-antigen ligase
MPTSAEAQPPSRPKGRPGRGRTRRLALSEKIGAALLLLLVFAAVLAFGASDIGTAAVFAGLYAVFLAGLLATCGWARRDLVRLKRWRVLALLFSGLLIAVLWPLTPWGPGDAHPAWSYLPGVAGSLTVDRSALALNVIQLLGLACLLVAGRIVGGSDARARWLLRAAVFAVALYALVGFMDHVTMRRSSRLAATLLSPNSAATVFGGGLLLAMAFSTYRLRRAAGLEAFRRGDPQLVLGVGAGAVLLIALLLTASRGGVVATLVGAALFLVWEGLSQRHRLRASAMLGAVAMMLLAAGLALRSTNAVTERFNLAERDAGVRATIFAPHWEAFQATPWSGYGLGSFPTVNQLIVTSETLPALHDVRAAHNLYLQWLEEGGIVGSAAMAALFLGLIWPIVRGAFGDGAVGIWCRATACGAVVFLIHGVTDFGLQVPAIQALAVMVLGVVGGMTADRRTAGPTTRLPEWPVGLAAAGAVTVSVVAMLSGLPLVAAKLGGDFSSWPTAPADALARAIETGLEQPGVSADQSRRLDHLSARELALRPASGGAWLRRAGVEALLSRDEAANRAFERSFAVAPLQASLFARRTSLAYERWDRLSVAARDQTIYQMNVEWRRRHPVRQLVAMANHLRNPAGRVGMALQITVLRLDDPPPRR